MVDDTFNVASKDDPLQTRAREEANRQKKIAEISDNKLQRNLQTMLNDRDHKVAERKALNDRKEGNYVAEQVEKIKHEPKMHLKPQNAPAESVIDRSNRIRKQVRAGYGKELDKELRRYEDKFNKNIDRSISKAEKKELNLIRDREASLSFEGDSGSKVSPTNDFRKDRGRPHKIGHSAKTQINAHNPKNPSYEADYKTLSNKMKKEREGRGEFSEITADFDAQQAMDASNSWTQSEKASFENRHKLAQSSIAKRLEKRQNQLRSNSKSRKI